MKERFSSELGNNIAKSKEHIALMIGDALIIARSTGTAITGESSWSFDPITGEKRQVFTKPGLRHLPGIWRSVRSIR